MSTFVGGIAIALAPFALTVSFLWLAVRIQRRRQQAVARQVELTEAIHRELGAVAAPTVHPAAGGSWQVSMDLPIDRPETLGALVRITERVMTRERGPAGRRIRIALTATDRKAA